MWDGLIGTKLVAPGQRGDLIGRPRLRALLERTEETPAALVIAPAGFGKSTLLADWHDELKRRGHKVGWLSIDPDDDEPLRFLGYLAAALNQAEPTLAQRAAALLRSVPVNQPESLLPLIVNDLAALESRVALFLDDVHLLQHPAIAGFLDKLLAYAPRNLCLYLACRSEPPLQIQRLRLTHHIAVLTADSLRFDRAEAEQFLNATRGLALSQSDLALLHGKTEGWPAGLRLASLSLERRSERSSFLRSFSGTDSDVTDFLAHDVLLRQPQEVQDFLLATAVLTRFDAALAAHVTGRRDAGAMLDRLWAANLFLVPLDSEGRWFRYHHLFADFLRARLERLRPGAALQLHRKAAAWHEGEGDIGMALHHALAAGDADWAAAVVDNAAMEHLRRGQLTQLRDWLGRVPEEALERRPRLHLMHAWIGFHMLEPRRGMRHLALARQALGPGNDLLDDKSPGLTPSLLAEMRTLVAGTLSATDHNRWARDLARRWFDRVPLDQPFLRGTLSNILGFSHYTLGELPQATAAAERGRHEHTRSRSVFGLVYAELILALVEKAAGRLFEAERRLEQASRLARDKVGSPSYPEAMVAVFLAELAYERGELATARRLLEDNNYIIEGTAMIVHALSGHLHLARLEALQGRSHAALAILGRAESLGRERLYRRLRASVLNDEVRLQLAGGDLAAAQAALGRAGLLESRLAMPALPAPAVELEQVAVARVLIAERRYDDALRRLEGLARRVEGQGRRRRLLQLQCLQAIALQRAGRQRAAEDLLRRALALAEPQGFLRSIADEGRGLRPVLTALLARATQSEALPSAAYLQRLLAALVPEAPALPAAPDPQLQEALSPRELEIVRLLARGCSNEALARALALSPTTVKWHLRNIYGKLGVKTRTQALLAAQQLQLVT